MTKQLLLLFSLSIFISCSNHTLKKNKGKFKQQIQNQISKIEGDVAYTLFDISKNNTILAINSNEKFHAASTMKVPVMIEVYKQASDGKFKLGDSVVVKNEFKSIVDGSLYQMDISVDGGEDLYKMVGQKVTIKKLVYDMITVSSNLATNILIDMVDAKKVTETMRTFGANKIEVLRGVEDIKAYEQGLSNSTTSNDLVQIMKSLATKKTGTKRDAEEMIAILKEQRFNDLIPKYFPEFIEVAHKTGSITGVHHDAAIIYLPNGKKYVLVILSKNLKDFDAGTDALAKISKTTLDYLLQ